MRIHLAAVTLALGVAWAPVHANQGQGLGVCRSGFADGTVVATEGRGNVTVGQLQVGDRVWSLDEGTSTRGWSRVLRRVDAGPQYKILADFTAPGSSVVTKACWVIKSAG